MEKIYKASRKSPSVATSPRKQSIEVVLSDHSLIYRFGILKKRSQEIPYNKINSINIKQSLIERSLGYGDVIIMTGNDVNGIVLQDIENPQQLKQDIMLLVHPQKDHIQAPKEPDQSSLTEKLEELSNLKDKGIITQQEFDQKKQQILGI